MTLLGFKIQFLQSWPQSELLRCQDMWASCSWLAWSPWRWGAASPSVWWCHHPQSSHWSGITRYRTWTTKRMNGFQSGFWREPWDLRMGSFSRQREVQEKLSKDKTMTMFSTNIMTGQWWRMGYSGMTTWSGGWRRESALGKGLGMNPWLEWFEYHIIICRGWNIYLYIAVTFRH